MPHIQRFGVSRQWTCGKEAGPPLLKDRIHASSLRDAVSEKNQGLGSLARGRGEVSNRVEGSMSPLQRYHGTCS